MKYLYEILACGNCDSGDCTCGGSPVTWGRKCHKCSHFTKGSTTQKQQEVPLRELKNARFVSHRCYSLHTASQSHGLHPAPFVKMPQNLVKFLENLHISYERILSTIKSLEQTYKFAPQRKDPIQKSLDIKFKLVFKRLGTILYIRLKKQFCKMK